MRREYDDGSTASLSVPQHPGARIRLRRVDGGRAGEARHVAKALPFVGRMRTLALGCIGSLKEAGAAGESDPYLKGVRGVTTVG